MKVIGIKQKIFEKKHTLNDYLTKVSDALSYSPDIVVGPDYSLYFLDSKGHIQFNKVDEAVKRLKELSRTSKTLIAPGTLPLYLDFEKIAHSAPIFKEGNYLFSFRKETDVENSDFATKNDLVYERGDSSKNKLFYNGKKIAFEICSDHGKQLIDKDTFLEIIMAYDDKAGFYLRPNNDNFSRYAIVVDGRKPDVSGFRYDFEKKKLSFLKEKKINNSLVEFNLKC